jgi:hypothetical protein
MPVYRVDPNPHRVTYGTTVGVLVMQSRVPCIPGSVSNASSYDFPVVYRVVEGLDVKRLVFEADASLAAPVIAAAQELERAGVSAITTDCGYMAWFQSQVAAAVKVPVCLSSLLQAPFIRSLLAPARKLGVVVADSRSLRPQMLAGVGVDASQAAIAGMEGRPAFWSAIMDENGTLDSDAIEREVLEVVGALVAANPSIGALLLECSEFPPYSAAVQAKFRLPVFDFQTLIRYVYASLAHRPYRGTM